MGNKKGKQLPFSRKVSSHVLESLSQGVHSHVDKVWFVKGTQQLDVYQMLEDEYDFPITIMPDECE